MATDCIIKSYTTAQTQTYRSCSCHSTQKIVILIDFISDIRGKTSYWISYTKLHKKWNFLSSTAFLLLNFYPHMYIHSWNPRSLAFYAFVLPLGLLACALSLWSQHTHTHTHLRLWMLKSTQHCLKFSSKRTQMHNNHLFRSNFM